MALDFNGGSTAYTPQSGTLDFGGAAPPPALPFLDFNGASAAYTLPRGELDFGGKEIPKPQPAPGIINTIAAPWRDTSQRIAAALVAAWQNARSFTRSVAVPFAAGTVKDRETAAEWSSTRQFNRAAQLRWQNANPMAREESAVWLSQIPHRDAYAAIPRAKHARIADRVENTVWLSPAPKDTAAVVQWAKFKSQLEAGVVLPWAAPTNVNRSAALPWGVGRLQDHGVGSNWHVDPNPPSPFDPPQIPSQEVYIVSNSVSVVRASDNTPIVALGVSLSLDQDAYAWQMQIALGRENDLTLLEPTTSGPQEVKITINGFVLLAIVEGYSRDRVFGKSTWVVKGRSRSAYLDAPYASPRTFQNTGLTTAAQLAGDELTNVGGGWTLNWHAQDWNIQAGQFSYANLTPIQAISKLAAAIGAVVLPDPATKTLNINSSYPTSPSGWAAATPDAIIPESVLTKLSLDWISSAARNAVYVTGGQQGVAVNATLYNTAGDSPILGGITDPLITAVEAGQERGRVAIVDTGPRMNVQIALPVISPVGLRQPGDLLQINEDGGWRGLVQTVSLSASVRASTDVVQTLTLQRRT